MRVHNKGEAGPALSGGERAWDTSRDTECTSTVHFYFYILSRDTAPSLGALLQNPPRAHNISTEPMHVDTLN